MNRKPRRAPSAVSIAVGAVLCWASLAATGCGSGTEHIESDLSALEQRVAELERSSGRYQAQLHDVEEDVLLLEDRVEAHRISLERRGTVRARSHDELPSYRPPRVEPDHRYMTDLPVERLEPPERPAERDTQDLEELVITNETLAAFVEENGGAAPASYGGDDRRSLPPVVTGDRLPAGRQLSLAESARPAESREEASLDEYQVALELFNQGSYRQALDGFSSFLRSGPSVDYEDNALFWIGECHYALANYSDALESFERVVRDYPDGNKVPDSLLKIGLTYEQMNARDRASEVLVGLVETYPTTDAARRASERLAELN